MNARRYLALTLAGLLALAGSLVVSWRFGARAVAGHAVPVGRARAAYRVGSCLTEANGPAGRPLLRSVDCTGSAVVLRVDGAVPDGADCARTGDFTRYGLVQYDRDAGTYYCLALAVPAQACLVIGRTVAPHRVPCGSRPVERVAALARGTDPGSACAGVPRVADIWYYRSPRSHTYACLVRDGG